MKPQKVAILTALPLGALLGITGVLIGLGVPPSKIIPSISPTCPVSTIVRDWYQDKTKVGTRYRLVNGKPVVGSGDIVLDCGSFTGDTTRDFLDLGASVIVAIDPAESAMRELRKMFAPEIAKGSVIPEQVAVFDHAGEMELTEHDNPAANSLIYEGTRKVMVPVTTIDALVAKLNLSRVDLIKLDIEGAERWALKGAAGTIKRFRPRIIAASYHLPDDYEQIPITIRSIDTTYRLETGRCRMAHSRIIPNLLYFF